MNTDQKLINKKGNGVGRVVYIAAWAEAGCPGFPFGYAESRLRWARAGLIGVSATKTNRKRKGMATKGTKHTKKETD
jgi:hypothetical protein